MAQVAVNWTANRPGVATVIVGAEKLSQLEDNIQALDFEIPTESSNRLEAVSRPEPQFLWRRNSRNDSRWCKSWR